MRSIRGLDALNLPNLITMARILLVPVVIWLVLEASNLSGAMVAQLGVELLLWLATAAFILSIATDGVDGAIARRRGLITNLGKILDPIADKALLGGLLFVLSLLGEVPWWVTILILFRELGITVYRLVVAKRRVLAASGGGKLKTIFQAIAVGMFISPISTYWTGFAVLEELVLYSALALTLWSGISYVLAEVRLARANRLGA